MAEKCVRIPTGERTRKKMRLTCGPFCNCLPLPDGSHPNVPGLRLEWQKPHIKLVSELEEGTEAEDLVELRRHFHRFPELSYEEKHTSQEILKKLRLYARESDNKRVTIVENVDDTYGLWIDITFGDKAKSGPFIMIRADMDALPIEEKSGAPYASKIDGVMHACGHDGHMAILLTTAKILLRRKRSKLQGRVRLLFQPAEEGGAGAKRMIKGGCLKGIDSVYGLHLWNCQPVGTVGVAKGPITANSDRFKITVRGKGGYVRFVHRNTTRAFCSSKIRTRSYDLLAHTSS